MQIWVGTETRDYDNKRWGRKVQYEAYYIMRWLGEIGGSKTGGGRFGLTLRGGWESPPTDTKLNFVQPQRYLSRVPEKFPFPTSGDLRWRPFFAGDKHARHTSLLQLRDDEEKYLGDAVAYVELKGGGRILYVWFSLLNGPYAERLLYNIFEFVAWVQSFYS